MVMVETMKLRLVVATIFLGAALGLAGCGKEAPVELVQSDGSTERAEVINTPSMSDPLFSGGDVDSTMPSLLPGRVFGQMIVSGLHFESPLESYDASLARAVFFDRNAPILTGTDTAYRTLDIGALDVDGIRMMRALKLSPMGSRDTLGVQYVVGSRGGGRPFVYKPVYVYAWQAEGADSIPPFGISFVSADTVRIVAPVVGDVVPAGRDLVMRWNGGASELLIQIGTVRPGELSRSLFRLRVRTNRGRAIIPSRVLQLLPRDYPYIAFSLISEKHSTTRVSGFGDEVLLQSAYAHSIVVRVQQ